MLNSGRINRDSGPDFTEARIKVGKTTLVGNIELHLKSSDWNKHGHHNDPAYKNIILHVVYEHDRDPGLSYVPVIELQHHIAPQLLKQYERLLNATNSIPCAQQHKNVRELTKESWLDRLLAERWEEKLHDWNIMLDASAEDWRNLLYWRMAANFGFKVNAAPFLALARSLPLNVLARHRENLFQIEALLLGQAGLLDKSFEEDYPDRLQGEYLYLKQKYKLQPIHGHLWKFMRMRPANFPTVRIAQFAALIHKSVHLFSQIIESHSINAIKELLDVAAGEYWNDHFRLDEPQKGHSIKTMGKTSIQNIIINTVAPIQFLYASRQAGTDLGGKALKLLETLPPEENAITRRWKDNGWVAVNASQSQALIQLFNQYCSAKRCLECAVGLSVIRSEN